MVASMDEDISRWILEFLCRHSISDQLVNRIFFKLPVSNNDLRLKKTILLRSIQSEISDGSISETILECLETIENLEKKEGNTIIDSMKVAYCAVAVECTVKYLGVLEKHDKYFEALTRVWRDRIGNLTASDLVTDELVNWRDDLEAAVFDSEICSRLLKNTRKDALCSVAAYLAEAKAAMGPTFLEIAAATMRQSKEMETETEADDGVGESERLADMMVEKEAVCDEVEERAVGAKEKGKGIQKASVLPRRKHVASHRRARGGIKITDNEEANADVSCSKYNTVSTPEVSKAQEALKSSCLELQLIVRDPLPDALRMAQAVISGMARESQHNDSSTGNQHPLHNNVPNHEPSVENQNAEHNNGNPSIENPHVVGNDGSLVQKRRDVGRDALDASRIANVNSVQADGNQRNHTCSHQNTVPKPSLMQRNSTAHTYEWEDSIDDSPGPSNINRPHLPSPKKRLVSPLKTHEEITKFARRRQKKRWTVEEEEALRTGVAELGKGNWKLILRSNPDAFAERTEVDLKDKWRNMTRY